MRQAAIIRRIVLALVAVLMIPLSAHAQAWPTRQPIIFKIPYPPGGASDVTARILGAKLSESLGTAVVIDNRPGANGIIALESTARAAPDGYTILMANLGPNAINAVVYKNLPFDPIKSFAPITLTTIVPQIMVVTPSLPIRSVQELIAYAKANPGKLTFASAGVGASIARCPPRVRAHTRLGVVVTYVIQHATLVARPISNPRYFVCDALTGSLTASYLSNSTLYNSPLMRSTRRIYTSWIISRVSGSMATGPRGLSQAMPFIAVMRASPLVLPPVFFSAS